jgi:hypothetical protein
MSNVPGLSVAQQPFIWAMQNSRTSEGYELQLNNLRLLNRRAATYVSKIDPDQWCRFEAEARNVSLYGVRTSNPVEQEFSRFRALRELPLYELFDQAVKFTGELFARGKERCLVESLGGPQLSTPSTGSVYRYTATTSGSKTSN